MEDSGLSIGGVIDIIFSVTKKKGNILADSYLIKNSSIISKWKSHKAKPTNEDISKIADFAFEESSEMQRKIIRNGIMDLIINSSLKNGIKSSLLRIEDFKEFLSEVLNVATAGKDRQQSEADLKARELKKNEFAYNDIENHKNNTETVMAFSDDTEGKYSGVVEFNMFLSKDRGEKSAGMGKNEGYKSNGMINAEINSNMQRKLKSTTTILGSIIVVVIIGLLAVNAADNSCNADCEAIKDNSDGVACQQDIRSTPSLLKKPGDTGNDDSANKSENAASGNENGKPTQSSQPAAVAKDGKTLAGRAAQPTASSKGKENYNEKAAEAKNTINNSKNTTTNTTTNTTKNNINNSTNIINNPTTNNEANINGDNNVQGQGSNIFINIEN